MNARFIMIRHGRTTANASGLLMGRTDSPLLPESLTEAAELGRTLDLDHSAVIHSSDQPRALRTAHLLGFAHRLQPIPEANLRERDFGPYTRKSFGELATDPEWPAVDTRYDKRPNGGESLRDVEKRVFARLLDLHRTLKPAITLIVVGHSTCWRLVEAILTNRRHDPFDEPIPPPLTVLEHSRSTLEILDDYT